MSNQTELLEKKITEFYELEKNNKKRQEVIDFLLSEFRSLLIGKNISETIFDKDKNKIKAIQFGKITELFYIYIENSPHFHCLVINEIYELAIKGGFESDEKDYYLLK